MYNILKIKCIHAPTTMPNCNYDNVFGEFVNRHELKIRYKHAHSKVKVFSIITYQPRVFPFSTYAILHAIWTPPALFACNTQWKCIEDLTPPLPRCICNTWKAF